MPWVTYFLRKTIGNMRREPVMNGATVLALAVAFLCFCSFFFVASAIGDVVARWAADYHVSVYLADGVSDQDARRVASTFEALEHVEQATVVTSAETRQRLVSDLGGDELLGGLDPRLFPTTIEVRLRDDVRDPALIAALADRFQALSVVDQVETYGDLFARLRVVSAVARAVSVVLGLIVLLATLLVVANTIRLSLLGRRDEIEIMKLCGATDRFVRTPFLLAGAVQGLLGALVSLGLLALVGGVLHRAIGPLAPALLEGLPGGIAGLSIPTAASIVVAGVLLGLAGSHLSVRRFLREAP